MESASPDYEQDATENSEILLPEELKETQQHKEAEISAWEAYAQGEGPYPWHLV